MSQLAAPSVEMESVHIRQPDGSILTRGRLRVVPAEISTGEFARRTGLSRRYVDYLCQIGEVTSRRLSPKPGSSYRIEAAEVDRWRARCAAAE